MLSLDLMFLNFLAPRTHYEHRTWPHRDFSHLLNELISTWLEVIALPKMLRNSAPFKRSLALPLEILGESSANNCREDSPILTRGWCSQSVFKNQSFRTQNTVFLMGRVRDGYFPRAAHKSPLFCKVSENPLRADRRMVVWDRIPLPPFPGTRQPPFREMKENTFVSEGILSLKLTQVQPFVVCPFAHQVVLHSFGMAPYFWY